MIKATFHTAVPTNVKARNFRRGMWISPAGSEMIVRSSGEKRSAKTIQWPWRWKKFVPRSTSSQSTVNQRPQRSISGINRR